jgi:hypothetical protein
MFAAAVVSAALQTLSARQFLLLGVLLLLLPPATAVPIRYRRAADQKHFPPPIKCAPALAVYALQSFFARMLG